MSSNNFSEIFKIYEINPNQTNKAQKVRAYLRRQLKKNFPNKSLSDLTKVERDTFIYMIIKEDMMSRYINGQHRSRINNRINEYLRANLSLAELNVHKKQHFHSIINKQYYLLEIRGSQPSVCLSAASDRAMLRCSTRMPEGTSGLADEKLRIFEMPAATAASQTSWQA